MIKVASHPRDLSTWNGNHPSFYMEIFGETEPLMDRNYGEILPPGGIEAKTTANTPIYEYWWTIGHLPFYEPGNTRRHRSRNDSPWRHLRKEAAHVYLYFPINAGWRIKELVATTKYLSPAHHELTGSEKAAHSWQKISPVLSEASTLAPLLAPLPGVGAAAAGAAPVLSALSKLRIGSVPQGPQGYDWFVKKVTTSGVSHRGVMQGVMWSLPKDMFMDLGGRLTGSLAVSFIPNARQPDKHWRPEAGAVHGHAGVFSTGRAGLFSKQRVDWVPSVKDFVELKLSPRWAEEENA